MSAVTLAQQTAVRTSPFNPVEMLTGETINAFYLSIFIIGATGAPVTRAQDWYLIKQRSGQAAVLPQPGQTGTSNVRNQIIHEEKGLVGSGDGTAMAFQGVIRIPRGMRRTRDGDIWSLQLVNNDPTSDATFCVKAIYKSYS